MYSPYFYPPPCRLLQALGEGQALDVQMNHLEIISFTGHTRFRAIGTRDLNGCTVIIVVSEFGALISHISPRPYPTTDPYAGEVHMRAKIMEVCRKIRNQDGDFYTAGRMKVGILCAAHGGRVGLPHQRRIAEMALQRVCRPQCVRTFSYEVGTVPRTGAKGTVFVDGRAGFGKVFVEDQELRWFRDV
jgi:hypothetical protein